MVDERLTAGLDDPDVIGQAEYRAVFELVEEAEDREQAIGICQEFVSAAQAIAERLERRAAPRGGSRMDGPLMIREDDPEPGEKTCSCRWYDDGDVESGPHLSVDGDKDCPLHGEDAMPMEWACLTVQNEARQLAYGGATVEAVLEFVRSRKGIATPGCPCCSEDGEGGWSR